MEPDIVQRLRVWRDELRAARGVGIFLAEEIARRFPEVDAIETRQVHIGSRVQIVRPGRPGHGLTGTVNEIVLRPDEGGRERVSEFQVMTDAGPFWLDLSEVFDQPA